MAATNEHSAPWACVYAKDEGDNCRPGAPPRDDGDYFEVLCLCLLQSGLNWGSVRRHWPRYRAGFLDFDPARLSRASAEDLLESPDVIRNRRKIEAVIHNAEEFLAVAREHGSFRDFLETLRPLGEGARLKALGERFKGVGPETADYFFHSVGF